MNTNMSLCGECEHGGFCNTSIPACICPMGVIGAHCQIDVSLNPKNREGLTLLPVAVGVVIMYALCFMIMYLNSWNSNRVSRARQAEIDEAAQVEGPPRVSSSVGIWRGNPLRPSTFFLPFFGTPRLGHSRECVTTSLPGVSTAPAVLQGAMPPKYSHIVPCDDDSFGSYATVEGGSPTNSIPPSYDDVLREGPLSDSGIMMHSIPSLSSDMQDSVILGEQDSRVIFTTGTGSTVGEDESANQQTRLLDETIDDDLNEQPIAGNLVTFSSPLEETIPAGIEMGARHNSNSLI